MPLFKSKSSDVSGVPPGPIAEEKRRESRVSLFMRPGKLIVDDMEYLCIVRDVSQGGVKLQLFHPLPSGRAYEIELPTGVRCRVRNVWEEGNYFGFEITNPLSLQEFIKEARDTDHRKQVRINRAISGAIHVDDTALPVQIKNISQQGALIECDEHMPVDQIVRLETTMFPPFFAKVKWRHSPNYGLIFEEVMRLDRLAALLGPQGQRDLGI